MATFTITVPDADVPRVRAAVTFLLQSETPATVEDVRQLIIRKLKQIVLNAEQEQAERAARLAVKEVDFT